MSIIIEKKNPSPFVTPIPIEKKDTGQSSNRKKILVLAGPTATGKTHLSISMAKAIDGEIISADSMQVYKSMDIGTAKASKQQQEEVPHHLIDIRDVNEPFNVMDFYRESWRACRDILIRNKVPIIVGGTGFYIHAFIYGPPKGPPSVPEIRKKIEEDLSKFGPEMLYERLKAYDPDYASTITQRDKHKIVRALEIISISNQRVSDFGRPSIEEESQNLDFRCWFIYYPREILYSNIEKRCDEMISQGFVEEVKKLLAQGIKENSSASQSIGYRQCIKYLESLQTEENWNVFAREFKTASKRYAKRQFTWFRKEPLFRWLDLLKFPSPQALEIILQDFETST